MAQQVGTVDVHVWCCLKQVCIQEHDHATLPHRDNYAYAEASCVALNRLGPATAAANANAFPPPAFPSHVRKLSVCEAGTRPTVFWQNTLEEIC